MNTVNNIFMSVIFNWCQASAHILCSGGGGGSPPLQKFSGGGLFNSRGGLFRSNLNPKKLNFSDDFPVIFWFIHTMLLH